MNTPIAWLAEVLGILRGREEALRIQGYWGEADHLKRLIEAAPTDAAPQAATGTVPPESSAPAVAAPHAHRCMSCGARWYCPHQPGNCTADENVFPSLVLPGPDGPTVFHHVCRNKPQPSAKQDTSPQVSHTDVVRSIESAPKDANGVIAYSPKFYQDKGGWVAAVWVDGGWHSNPGGWRFEPTHWMPMPWKP